MIRVHWVLDRLVAMQPSTSTTVETQSCMTLLGLFPADHRCGSGQACSDAAADPEKFKKFHEQSGSTIKMFQFDTTTEVEKQIANNIEEEGGVIGGLCASAASSVISGVGPFKNIKPTLLPGSLADQLDKLKNPPAPKKK